MKQQIIIDDTTAQVFVDQLPGSKFDAHAEITLDAIGVRVGSLACIAAPRWFSRDQLSAIRNVADRLLDRWPAES
jgi:hypothetical protein